MLREAVFREGARTLHPPGGRFAGSLPPGFSRRADVRGRTVRFTVARTLSAVDTLRMDAVAARPSAGNAGQ